MIDSISGRVERRERDHIVIDTGGLAFAVTCPARDLAAWEIGSPITAFVHLVVRDDAMELYGFASIAERSLFRALISVSQVGPRLAVQVLSSLSEQDLVRVIRAGDIERLTAVKGIGRKTAQRLVIDLRDKLTDAAPVAILFSETEEAAIRALTSRSLGFPLRDARHAVDQLRGENLPLQDLVRRALESLGASR
ncbi:Holliday junction branch migration protein RuvA [Candidatus Bipolaricaulota bacterium]|nr:Holliday junction branch migration protein RuvA [Candidatus Bipolaricaulota bacterium]